MPSIADLRAAFGESASGRSDEELLSAYASAANVPPGQIAQQFNWNPSNSGQWGNRASAAIDSYQANLYGIGEALGGPRARAGRIENEFSADVARSRAQAQGAVSSYKDVNSIGSAANYVGGLAVDSAPYLTEALIGGGIGGMVARGAGVAARGTGMGLARTAGAVGASYPSGVGDVLSNQREQNGQMDLGTAAALGIPYAALNAFGLEGALARRSGFNLVSRFDDAARYGGTKRLAANAGVGAVTEGASETGQEFINQMGRNAVDPNAGYFGPEAMDRYGESFVGGAALGGVGAGAMGGWRRSEQWQPPAPIPSPDTQPINLLGGPQLQLGYSPFSTPPVVGPDGTVYLDPMAARTGAPQFTNGPFSAYNAGAAYTTDAFRPSSPPQLQYDPRVGPAVNPMADNVPAYVTSEGQAVGNEQYFGPEFAARDYYMAQQRNMGGLGAPRQEANWGAWIANQEMSPWGAPPINPVAQLGQAPQSYVDLLGTPAPTPLQMQPTVDPFGDYSTRGVFPYGDSPGLSRESDRTAVTGAPSDSTGDPKYQAEAVRWKLPEKPTKVAKDTLVQAVDARDNGDISKDGYMAVMENLRTGKTRAAQTALKNELSAELGRKDMAAGKPAPATTKPPAVVVQPTTGVPNGSVRDVPGQPPGGSSVAGGAVAQGSVAGAGPNPVAAVGVPAPAPRVGANDAAVPAGNGGAVAGAPAVAEKRTAVLAGNVDFDMLQRAVPEPRMLKAIRLVLGVDRDGNRMDKPLTMKAAAAQAGLGDNSHERVSKMMKDLGITAEVRNRFLASDQAASSQDEYPEDEGDVAEDKSPVLSDEEKGGDREPTWSDAGFGAVSTAAGSQGKVESEPKGDANMATKSWYQIVIRKKGVANLSHTELATLVSKATPYINKPASRTALTAIMDEVRARQKDRAFLRAMALAYNEEYDGTETQKSDAGYAADEAARAGNDEDVPGQDGGDGRSVGEGGANGQAPQGAAAAPVQVTTKKRRTIQKFSKGAGKGSTIQSVKDALEEVFWNAGLFDGSPYGGHVRIHQTEERALRAVNGKISAEEMSNAQGFVDPTDDRVIHLIADNINPGDEVGVLLHELGVHVGLKKQLGALFKVLETQVESWKNQPIGSMERTVYDAAKARVVGARLDGSLDEEVAAEELVAYAAEEASRLGVTPDDRAGGKLMQWMKSLQKLIESAFRAITGRPITLRSLTAQQLVDFAAGAARIHTSGQLREKGALPNATKDQIMEFYSPLGEDERYPDAKVVEADPFKPGEEAIYWGAESSYGPSQGTHTYGEAHRARVPEDNHPAGFGKFSVYTLSDESIRLAKRTGTMSNAILEEMQFEFNPDTNTWSLSIFGPNRNSQLFRDLKYYGNASEISAGKSIGTGWTRLENVSDSDVMEHLVEARRRLTRALGGEVPSIDWFRATGANPGKQGSMTAEKVKRRFSKAPANAQTQPQNVVDKAIQAAPAAVRPIMRSVTMTVRRWGRAALNNMTFTEDLLNRAKELGLAAADTYRQLSHQKAGFIGEHERRVLTALDGYRDLPAELQGKGPGTVNEYLKNSTMSRKWGYQPAWLPDQVVIDPQTKAAYDALGPEGQKFVDTAFKIGADTLAEKKALVISTTTSEYDNLIAAAKAANDTDEVAALEKEKADALSKFGSLMSISGREPYSPIKRFGNWIVMAKSARYIAAEKAGDTKQMRQLEKDENHYYVDFAESEGAAEAVRDELRADGNYVDPVVRARETMRDELYGGSKTLHALSKLRARVDMMPNDEDKAVTKKLRELLTDMYLLQLAEDSSRKSEMRRRGIAGDIDMIRSLEAQGKADAGFMGSLKYAEPLMQALNDMRRQMRDSATGQQKAQSEAFNEIIKRHLQGVDFKPTPWASTLVRGPSLWFLATSPSYYLQNATQPWTMSLPVMAGRHDVSKSGSALMQAYGDVAAAFKDANVFSNVDFDKVLAGTNLKGDEREMLRSLLNRNKIDIGIATELGDVRATAGNSASRAWNRVDQGLRGLQLKMESLNRVTTALAAYRLEFAKTKNAEQAAAYADEVIEQTHGDYSAWNAPRAFNTGFGKVALQFKKYQLIQLTLLAKLARNSFGNLPAEEKAMARKALAYTLGQAMILGGGKALPIPFALAWLFGKVFGEGDGEPPEYVLRKMIGDKDVADLLINGLPAKMFGFNGSALAGFGNAVSALPFTDINLADRASLAEAGFALMSGPLGGLTLRAADGIGFIQNGDYYRGLESLLPKGFTNVMKAGRVASEGIQQKDGDVTLSPDEVTFWDTAQQAIGFTPQRQVDRLYRQKAAYDIDQALSNNAKEIKAAFAKAVKAGEDTTEIRAAWAEYQDRRVKLGFNRQPMQDLLKVPQEQGKRERNTAGNVQFNKQNERFVRELESN